MLSGKHRGAKYQSPIAVTGETALAIPHQRNKRRLRFPPLLPMLDVFLYLERGRDNNRAAHEGRKEGRKAPKPL